MKTLFLFLIILFTFACGDTSTKDKTGQENEACYEDQTCNGNLTCVSSICIIDKCIDITCNSWEICIPSNGKCSIKSGHCNNGNDCSNGDVCNNVHKCVANDLCANETCSKHGTCKILNSNAVCVCENGFNNTQDSLKCLPDSTATCEGITCDNHGKCALFEGSPLCSCDDEYELSGDRLHCTKTAVDPCNGINCSLHGECKSDTGIAICECATGYVVNNKTECINPCKDVTCSDNGTCKVSNNAALCDCNTGYKLVGTTNCVLETNPCDNHETCGGHGTCTVDGDNPLCTCENNDYFVTENLECINPCEGHDCSNHGTCVGTSATEATCTCDSENGYFPGENFSCINPCEGHDCSNHGTCVGTSATEATCTCDSENGYFPGENFSCINPCEGKPCKDNNSCISINVSTCSCNNGLFQTENFDCIEPCDGKICGSSHGVFCGACDAGKTCTADQTQCVTTCNLTCSGHGTCAVNNDNPECICSDGYTGIDCSTCASGYVLEGNNCVLQTIWCNLQHPRTLSLEQNTEEPFVYGQIYVNGITTLNVESNEIKSALGYTTDMGNPVNMSNFTWKEAIFNEANKGTDGGIGNNHEYKSTFPTSTVGTFKYIYRFSLNATTFDDENANWVYCDFNGAGGVNSDPFEIDQVGDATITAGSGNNNGDLFISEYIEGTSESKALEIYNPTSSDIDLSKYQIWLIQNGGNWKDKQLTLTGTLGANQTYVIVRDKSTTDAGLKTKADLLNNDVTIFNGNDAIAIVKDKNNDNSWTNDEIIDVFGKETGIDPPNWIVAGQNGAGKDHTIRRKLSVTQGNIDWDTSSANEWDILPKNTFDGLGVR